MAKTHGNNSSSVNLKYVCIIVFLFIFQFLYFNHRSNVNSSQSSQNPPPTFSESSINSLNNLIATLGNKLDSLSTSSTVATPANPPLPVLGDHPLNGAKPLYQPHRHKDAVFALACKYSLLYYKRFVGTLRKYEHDHKINFNKNNLDEVINDEIDIVLAVSPRESMKPGVDDYLREMRVTAYEFDVECKGPDNCRLLPNFLGYEDPRPHRTFANIRYALYEYWLRFYSERSYILILDFRDTFFQASPFLTFDNYYNRVPKYELQLFAENHKVKSIGNCVFNSNWISTCFSKQALESLKQNPVICSGSTLGSYYATLHYVRTMLSSMDSVKCWLKNIESDQGYQNFLYYNGYFNTPNGNATLFAQGYGVVNTIGAMNGFRVPDNMKGPLDTYWHARDKEGYIINYDGTRSACVHQWDRWEHELASFVDNKLLGPN